MSRPLPEDLRARLVAAVDGGMSRRAAAERFDVAASTAIKWIAQWWREGYVRAGPMGRPARFKPDALVLSTLTGETIKLDLPKQSTKMVAIPLPELQSDDYTVAWRAKGTDGHTMSGQFSFVVE